MQAMMDRCVLPDHSQHRNLLNIQNNMTEHLSPSSGQTRMSIFPSSCLSSRDGYFYQPSLREEQNISFNYLRQSPLPGAGLRQEREAHRPETNPAEASEPLTYRGPFCGPGRGNQQLCIWNFIFFYS